MQSASQKGTQVAIQGTNQLLNQLETSIAERMNRELHHVHTNIQDLVTQMATRQGEGQATTNSTYEQLKQAIEEENRAQQEHILRLERAVRARDESIARLESEIEEMKAQGPTQAHPGEQQWKDFIEEALTRMWQNQEAQAAKEQELRHELQRVQRQLVGLEGRETEREDAATAEHLTAFHRETRLSGVEAWAATLEERITTLEGMVDWEDNEENTTEPVNSGNQAEQRAPNATGFEPHHRQKSPAQNNTKLILGNI